MPELTLTDQERAVLAEVLDEYFRDLKEQINKAEATDFHAMLKRREEVIEGLLARIGPPPA